MDRQLFILDDAIWDSMSFDDVRSTIKDMQELDIAKPPCQYFDVMTKARAVDLIESEAVQGDERLGDKFYKMDVLFRYKFTDNFEIEENDMIIISSNTNKRSSFTDVLFSNDGPYCHLKGKELYDEFSSFRGWVTVMSAWVLAYLLVAMAAKNSIRTTKENKLMKLGIGKKKDDKYRYTTTITIGKITETEGTGGGGGWTVRPHLRRGHIREQRYGPNRQYSKKVFIQPVFVNASEDFINERKAYNVRVAS